MQRLRQLCGQGSSIDTATIKELRVKRATVTSFWWGLKTLLKVCQAACEHVYESGWKGLVCCLVCMTAGSTCLPACSRGFITAVSGKERNFHLCSIGLPATTVT